MSTSFAGTTAEEFTFLGEPFWAKNASGVLKTRIATVFPSYRLAVTLPGIHASQRLAFLDWINDNRKALNKDPLSSDQELEILSNSVDLIIEPGTILIRPDPNRMDLAFLADELLQTQISKCRIKFLHALNQKVFEAIRNRGESWRISPLPKSPDEMKTMLVESRMAIRRESVYYYNRLTGTRYLTYHEFSQLSKLDPIALAHQLQEIAAFSASRNQLNNPEIEFFKAKESFGGKDFKNIDFLQFNPAELSRKFEELKSRFQEAVDPLFQGNDLNNPYYRKNLFSALIASSDEQVAPEILDGLSPEFFLQVEWLPGARFEHGELIFDSIFDELIQYPDNCECRRICDEKVKGFIFNFIREYGDLEYVNVGRVASSMSLREPEQRSDAGRRELFIAEIKPVDPGSKVVRIIRMQKWGIRERLDDISMRKDLVRAILETEEYTEYVLDRRLACRQLHMNLPQKFTIGRVREVYQGVRSEFRGIQFWATYFERDYNRGLATDKIPHSRFISIDYALKFAHLLGEAAVHSIIVGKVIKTATSRKVAFDDGDETLVEDEKGLPCSIIVTDHTGAFADFETPLVNFAESYAAPINDRLPYVTDKRAFATSYLQSFIVCFNKIRRDYLQRKKAYNNLFKHLVEDPNGNLPVRWLRVLKRLEDTDADALCSAIESFIDYSRKPSRT